jgi:hypothetical protein
LRDLAAGKTTTTGAIGELRYAISLVDEGRNVTRLGETFVNAQGHIKKGVDIVIDNGKQVIDFKNYDFVKNMMSKVPDARTAADPAKLAKFEKLQKMILDGQVKKMAEQANRHKANWPGSELIFAFPKPIDAMPASMRKALEDAGAKIVEAPF